MKRAKQKSLEQTALKQMLDLSHETLVEGYQSRIPKYFQQSNFQTKWLIWYTLTPVLGHFSGSLSKTEKL